MAVSLFDMMRPVALFGGVGAAYSQASVRHAGVLPSAAATCGALLAGIAAFWLSQTIAGHLRLRPLSESILFVFYIAVFLGIALAAFGGGVGLLLLATAV